MILILKSLAIHKSNHNFKFSIWVKGLPLMVWIIDKLIGYNFIHISWLDFFSEVPDFRALLYRVNQISVLMVMRRWWPILDKHNITTHLLSSHLFRIVL